MLSSKQRAYLRGLANRYETILHIGKEGVTATVVKQADDALEARELIKGRVLENSGLTAREAADSLEQQLHCDVVQVIGSKFVLFRPCKDKDKRKIKP